MTESNRKMAEKIVGRQYVVVKSSGYFPVGSVIKLIEDDGTDIPRFEGDSYKWYLPMDCVMLIAETPEEKAEVTVEAGLPEHKYTFGQKLTVNGNEDAYWHTFNNGDTVTVTQANNIFRGTPMYRVISEEIGEEQYLLETQLEPVKAEHKYSVGQELIYNGNTAVWNCYSTGETVTVTDLAGFNENHGQPEYVVRNSNGIQYLLETQLEPVAEKPEFIPEVGQIYARYTVDTTEVDLFLQRTETRRDILLGSFFFFDGFMSPDSSEYTFKPATDEQKIQLLTAMAEQGDATEADLDLLSKLMPLDNPELTVGEVYYRKHGAIIRAEHGDTVDNGLTGNYLAEDRKRFMASNGSRAYICMGHRKALPHEVAKLEAAEKEHGCVYQKPLVNSIGTVIEVGQYYKSTGLFGKQILYRVDAVSADSYEKGKITVDPETGKSSEPFNSTDIDSAYGESAVPATPEEIALFKQAEAVSRIEVGKQYAVTVNPLGDWTNFVLTVTGKDAKNFQVTYTGYSGKPVGDSFLITDPMWFEAEEMSATE